MPGTVRPSNPRLDAVDEVVIDEGPARFKYILCRIYDPDQVEEFKYIVRGTAHAEFHSDIYDDLDAQMEQNGLVCECLGGGKIYHNPIETSIEVFGKSQGYGKANHSITVDILKRTYAHYKTIMWSDD